MHIGQDWDELFFCTLFGGTGSFFTSLTAVTGTSTVVISTLFGGGFFSVTMRTWFCPTCSAVSNSSWRYAEKDFSDGITRRSRRRSPQRMDMKKGNLLCSFDSNDLLVS